MLRVWVDSTPAGVLDRSGRRGSAFAYEPQADPRLAVSLTMPHRIESWKVEHGLPPIFDMNLPEGALRERLRTRFAKAVGTFDDFDLLSVVGRSQIGRMRFSAMEDDLDDEVPFQSIDEILKSRRDGDLFEYLLDTFATYSGLAGVQPKVMIRGTDGDGERTSPSIRGATHIVKLWDESEYPELAANEFFCLQAAREAGLKVPNFQLSEDGAALVVDRFDIGEGMYRGFEDFCVLNGVGSDKKYAGGYETKLFKRIADFVSPQLRPRALEEAFRLFVLNCALRNGDAHLKNFGLVYEDVESVVSLSPVYDIVTTRAYLVRDQMALTLDGSTNWPDRNRLLKLGQVRCGLKPSKVAAIIEQTCDAVAEIALEASAYFATSRFPDTGKAILSQWKEGIASLGSKQTLKLVDASYLSQNPPIPTS